MKSPMHTVEVRGGGGGGVLHPGDGDVSPDRCRESQIQKVIYLC